MTPRLKRIEWLTTLTIAASLAGCAYNPPPREEGSMPGTAAQTPPPAKPLPSAAEAKTPSTAATMLGQPEGAAMPSTSRPGELGKTTTEEGISTIPTKEEISRTVTHQIPSVKVCSQKGDINRMDESDFKALGFSTKDSRKIVDYREAHGNFKDVKQLCKAGISRKTLDRVQGRLAVSSDTG